MDCCGRNFFLSILLIALLPVSSIEGRIQVPNLNLISGHKDITLGQAVTSLKHISKAIKPSFKRRYPNLVFNGTPFTFKAWEQLANVDGWVCRSHADCSWISHELYCDTKLFNVTEVKASWPWKSQLAGNCNCPSGWSFDEWTGDCYNSDFPYWTIAVVVVAVSLIVILMVLIFFKSVQ